jgi:hypothetical protein
MSRLVGHPVSAAVHGLLALLLLQASMPKARVAPSAAAPANSGVEIVVVPQPASGAAPGLKSFSDGRERFVYPTTTLWVQV